MTSVIPCTFWTKGG